MPVVNQLYGSAGCGEVEKLKELIRQHPEWVNVAVFRGRTPLHKAAMCSRKSQIDALVEAGAVLDNADHSGCTALMHAAFRGSEAVVRALLEAGASVNTADHDAGQRFTLLPRAVASPSLTFWRLLGQIWRRITMMDAHPAMWH